MNSIELVTLAKTLLDTNTYSLDEVVVILIKEGGSVADIKMALGLLASAYTYTKKDILESIKKATPKKMDSRPLGLLGEFRFWLSDGERTEQEVWDKTMEIGIREDSVSYISYVGTRLDEWEMVERTIARLTGRPVAPRTLPGLNRAKAILILEQANKEPEAEPEAEFNWDDAEPESEQSEQEKYIAEAWAFLDEEMASAKPRKTRVHPDRVSHLNDSALTEAYTKAFQDLNKNKRSKKSA